MLAHEVLIVKVTLLAPSNKVGEILTSVYAVANASSVNQLLTHLPLFETLYDAKPSLAPIANSDQILTTNEGGSLPQKCAAKVDCYF